MDLMAEEGGLNAPQCIKNGGTNLRAGSSDPKVFPSLAPQCSAFLVNAVCTNPH